jgi:MinD-like ATPase involved in chromosome partitioning or flagellar assembly
MKMTKKSKLILSYSPQGGTGKSTVAINTALIFASKGHKTLLVDMSLYGSVISTLKIRQKSGQGIAGIINLTEIQNNDFTSDTSIIETARASITKDVGVNGLDVLVSANPIKMEGLNEHSTNEIVQFIKNFGYEYVMIDTSPELSIKNLILIDKVDYILLTALQDISCGWKMLLFKEIAQRFKIPKEKFSIIVNRVSKFSGFNDREFEEEIGYKVLHEFPEYQKEMQSFVNKGQLITSKYHKAVYQSFENMAKDIFDETKDKKK